MILPFHRLRQKNREHTAPAVRAPFVSLGRLVLIVLAAGNMASASAQDAGGGMLAPGDDLVEWAAAASRHYCMVVVGNPGTMAPSIGNAALSSKVAGGYAGTAEITATNSSYRASVIAPAAFVASPSLPGAVTFDTAFSGSGATNFYDVPGATEVKIKRGVTSISADLTATMQNGSFAAGQYMAELTLRCE
ncbi:MAG: hypothetical protein R3D45_16665 [Rhizobiaceae bacterium]